jgi:hypothetical protein
MRKSIMAGFVTINVLITSILSVSLIFIAINKKFSSFRANQSFKLNVPCQEKQHKPLFGWWEGA